MIVISLLEFLWFGAVALFWAFWPVLLGLAVFGIGFGVYTKVRP